MALITTLNVLVNGNAQKAIKALQGVRTGIYGVVQTLASTQGLVAGALAALGTGAAVAQLTALTNASFENADRLGLLSANLGDTTENLSRLEHAAKLSDVEAETLSASLAKMNINLADVASTGKGSAANALKTLGLNASELTSMLPSEALKQIADRIADVENPSQRAALAMDIFGKQGANMVGFLSNGADGIADLEKEADQLGITLKDIDAANINLANDAFDRLSAVMTGLGNAIAAGVAPYITDITDRFNEAATDGTNFGLYVSEAISWVGSGIGVVLDVLDVFRDGWKLLQFGAAKAIEGILWGINKLAEALDYLFGSKLAETTTALVEGAAEASQNAWEEFEQNFNDQTPSEALNQWMESVRANAESMRAELNQAPQAINRVSQSMIDATEDAGKLVEKLQEQIATFGMSSNEAEIFKLRQKGVSEQVLQTAASLGKELEELEKNKKKQDELKDRAKGVIDSIKTPQQKYNEEIARLTELQSKGLLSASQFAKAQLQAQKDILAGGGSATSQAVELGSSAASSVFANFYGRKTGPDSMAKDSLAEAKKQTALLNKIAQNKPAPSVEFTEVNFA